MVAASESMRGPNGLCMPCALQGKGSADTQYSPILWHEIRQIALRFLGRRTNKLQASTVFQPHWIALRAKRDRVRAVLGIFVS